MNLDLSQMTAAADEVSELLKSFASRHRLLILCKLTEGKHSVGELAEFLGLRDSTVSQHLALLRREGLVCAQRDGQIIWYGISSDPARQLLVALSHIFCKAHTSGARPAVRRVAAASSKSQFERKR
jgi:DNA-binding transcriptional ArsR family regulator